MTEGSPYLDPYREAVAQVGPRFEALLWKNAEAQVARFAAAAGMTELTGRVVADLGCGRADFASYLHGMGIQYGKYLGIEGVAELAEAASQRVAQEAIPECEMLVRDFVASPEVYRELVRTHRADVLTFSGSLNTLPQPQAEQTLDAAFEALELGGMLIFNFLSDRHGAERVGENTGPAHRYDTARLVTWSLDRSPLVQFRQDYLQGHDATIAIQKR